MEQRHWRLKYWVTRGHKLEKVTPYHKRRGYFLLQSHKKWWSELGTLRQFVNWPRFCFSSALQKEVVKGKKNNKNFWRSQVWCEQKNGFKKCLFYFFVSCLIFVLFCGWEKCLFRGAVDWVTKSFSKLCGKRQSRDCLFSCQFRGRKCGLSFLRKHATHLRCWGKQLSRVTLQRPENKLG